MSLIISLGSSKPICILITCSSFFLNLEIALAKARYGNFLEGVIPSITDEAIFPVPINPNLTSYV